MFFPRSPASWKVLALTGNVKKTEGKKPLSGAVSVCFSCRGMVWFGRKRYTMCYLNFRLTKRLQQNKQKPRTDIKQIWPPLAEGSSRSDGIDRNHQLDRTGAFVGIDGYFRSDNRALHSSAGRVETLFTSIKRHFVCCAVAGVNFL